ncbi:MAG: hypothetical protein VYE77_05645 [Planctomycetota bacterium]|nr:hypothetical protein [Planctomycetota bacterium]
MTRTFGWALAALLAGGLVAQDGARTPAGQAAYDKLIVDFDTAKAEFNAKFDAIKATEEWQTAMEARDNETLQKLYNSIEKVDAAKFAERAMELAAKHQGEDAVAFYCWTAVNGADRDLAREAMEALRDNHLQSPGLEPLMERGVMLTRTLGPDAGTMMLDLIIDENPHAMVRAWALYWKAHPVVNNRGRGGYSEDEKVTAVGWMDQAEKLAAGTPLAARIAAPRFEKERLQIGMVAPDIDGVDTDGTAFKLSDYRGKVVVLDFWGFW